MFKITLLSLKFKMIFPKVVNINSWKKYYELAAKLAKKCRLGVKHHFLCDELPQFCRSKTPNMARLQADCRAMVVLALVLMTDFIDWKIKSLWYRNRWPIAVASRLKHALLYSSWRVLNKCLGPLQTKLKSFSFFFLFWKCTTFSYLSTMPRFIIISFAF